MAVIPALLVDAFAAYRLTKLLTDDAVTEELRLTLVLVAYKLADLELPEAQHGATAVERVSLDDEPPKLATLFTCRWCMGAWVAAGVVAARRLVPRQWAPVADAAAIAAAAALLARFEDD